MTAKYTKRKSLVESIEVIEGNFTERKKDGIHCVIIP